MACTYGLMGEFPDPLTEEEMSKARYVQYSGSTPTWSSVVCMDPFWDSPGYWFWGILPEAEL